MKIRSIDQLYATVKEYEVRNRKYNGLDYTQVKEVFAILGECARHTQNGVIDSTLCACKEKAWNLIHGDRINKTRGNMRNIPAYEWTANNLSLFDGGSFASGKYSGQGWAGNK